MLLKRLKLMMIQSLGEMMQLVMEMLIEKIWQQLNYFLTLTLVAHSSGLKRGTENLKYVLETRRHCLSFLFSISFSETAPSGSKIKLKIRTVCTGWHG